MIFLIHGSSLFPNFFTQLVGDLLSWIVFAGWWEMGIWIMCIAVLAGGESVVCAVGGRLGRRNQGGGGAGGGSGGAGDADLEGELCIVS
jgi:hypothetical protein